MASDDIVRFKGNLWATTPKKIKAVIRSYIEEYQSFDPNSFLNIHFDLVASGTKLYDSKINLCQIVEADDLCKKCDQRGTIDCPFSITKKGEKSIAEKIVNLTDGIELFKHLKETYARIYIGGHYEVHPIHSRTFTEYLRYLYYQDQLRPASSDGVANAAASLSATARFEGKDFTLHNRVAWLKDTMYYDLSNSHHQSVKITPDGWEIVDTTEIPLFKRYGHQIPAPRPIHVDNPQQVIRRVLYYLNHDVKSKAMQILILISLITSFIPDIPHCVIIVYGDQGSAKTTFMKIFRRLVDPSDTDTMSFPRSKDLNQVLDHNWFCGFDNVGGLKKWLSDALCRAVTGDGNATRQHYTNDDDFIRKYKRVIALNGINNVATQPDLLDRSILFKLPRITGKNRKVEKDLLADFDNDHAEILGAIFSIIAKAYEIYPTIQLSSFFRLADWTVWGCAIAQALGYDPNEFTQAYATNKEEITSEALDNDDIATALVDFIHNHPEKFWRGRMTDLLPELNTAAGKLNISTDSKYWPKAPNSLSRRLNPFVTPLREAGIRYEMVEKENRIYEIEYVGGVEDVPTVPRGLDQYFDTSDDEITVSESDIASTKSTEKARESISDDTDDTDDILQNTVVGIPLPQERESRGVEAFENRWQMFLERTSDFGIKYPISDFNLDNLYKPDERGQLEQDLKDWEKEARVFRNKEGWRVAYRGAPSTEESKK